MTKSTEEIATVTQPAAAPVAAKASKATRKRHNPSAKSSDTVAQTMSDTNSATAKSATKVKAPAEVTTASDEQTASPVLSVKTAKVRKPKLVRDSFTFPKDEYAVIEVLKDRLAGMGQPVKKSELLRAGLKALAALSNAALKDSLRAVPSLKTGRPKSETSGARVPQATGKSPEKVRRKS